MNNFFQYIVAPGFFHSPQVLSALLLGGLVAAVSGVLGVFVVMREQAFAGHAIADFGGAGAAVAYLLGINTFWGFLGFGLLSAVGVELLGRRAKERDLATGVVLSFALGLESLFLFLDAHYTNGAGAPMMILFGSVFFVRTETIVAAALLTAVTAVALCAIYRPLLLCSVNPELAAVRGVPVRLVGIVFILLLALVVEEASLVTGALLSTALLIGPAAASLRFTHRMGHAMGLSAGIGVLTMALGILLSYDSYRWPPFGRGWPVSFFVCLTVLAVYLFSRAFGGKERSFAPKRRKFRQLRKEGHCNV